MIRYMKDKVVQPGIVSMELKAKLAIFSSGNAIYHRNWNYAYASAQANPKIAGKVGVSLTPTYAGHSPADCAGGWQYVVHQYSNHLNEAIELGKRFGATDGHKYVNGVLDRLAAVVRPHEVAAPRESRPRRSDGRASPQRKKASE